MTKLELARALMDYEGIAYDVVYESPGFDYGCLRPLGQSVSLRDVYEAADWIRENGLCRMV